MSFGLSVKPLVVGLAVALPPLNPFASGPSPQAVPLLTAWLCGAVLLGLPRIGSVRPVVFGWVAAGLLSTVIALCQYIGMAHHYAPWMNSAEVGEAYANLRQRNQFATFTNISVAALLWLLAYGLQRRQLHVRSVGFVAMALAFALLSVGNAASASRTGLLQLMLIVALTGLWRSPVRWQLFATACACLGLYALAAAGLPAAMEWRYGVAWDNVFVRMADAQGCSSRTVLWSNVLQLIAGRPWTGWGWGNLDYAHYATLYSGARFCDILDNAHNLPLHLAVELGIPVAFLMFSVLTWLVVRAAPWRALEPNHQLAWTVLAVIVMHSLVEYPLWYGPFQMAAALCVVLLIPASTSSQKSDAESGVHLVRLGLALVLAGVAAIALWDYHRVSELYRPAEARRPELRDNTLEKVQHSVFFRDQVDFAALSTTPLTRDNAASMEALAGKLIHYSPEPKVIEMQIESLLLLDRAEEASWHVERYQAAFPDAYARWRQPR